MAQTQHSHMQLINASNIFASKWPVDEWHGTEEKSTKPFVCELFDRRCTWNGRFHFIACNHRVCDVVDWLSQNWKGVFSAFCRVCLCTFVCLRFFSCLSQNLIHIIDEYSIGKSISKCNTQPIMGKRCHKHRSNMLLFCCWNCAVKLIDFVSNEFCRAVVYKTLMTKLLQWSVATRVSVEKVCCEDKHDNGQWWQVECDDPLRISLSLVLGHPLVLH